MCINILSTCHIYLALEIPAFIFCIMMANMATAPCILVACLYEQPMSQEIVAVGDQLAGNRVNMVAGSLYLHLKGCESLFILVSLWIL